MIRSFDILLQQRKYNGNLSKNLQNYEDNDIFSIINYRWLNTGIQQILHPVCFIEVNRSSINFSILIQGYNNCFLLIRWYVWFKNIRQNNSGDFFKASKNLNLKIFVRKNKKLFSFYDAGNVSGVVVQEKKQTQMFYPIYIFSDYIKT